MAIIDIIIIDIASTGMVITGMVTVTVTHMVIMDSHQSST
jgi:hypothetical protein